jgi:hypothetical protein
MKIKIITTAILLVSSLAQAQIVQEPRTTTPQGAGSAASGDNKGFKPESGNVSFEMNFNPLSAAPLSINYLRARYFLSSSTALRLGFSLATRSVNDNKSFEWAVLPGIEKHFAGTDRLSPFIGAELAIAGKSSSSSSSTGTGNSQVTTTTKGSWAGGSNRGFFNLGVNLVAGCDIYLSKHFYAGMEAGFGFSLLSESDVTTTVIPNGGSSTVTTTTGGSTFQLGPNYNSAVRLGFIF